MCYAGRVRNLDRTEHLSESGIAPDGKGINEDGTPETVHYMQNNGLLSGRGSL
jgi:hypothetical protein